MLTPLRLKKDCFVPPVSIEPNLNYFSDGGLIHFLSWTKSGIPWPLFETLLNFDSNYLKLLAKKPLAENYLFNTNRAFYRELDLNFETMRFELDRRIGEFEKPGKVSK